MFIKLHDEHFLPADVFVRIVINEDVALILLFFYFLVADCCFSMPSLSCQLLLAALLSFYLVIASKNFGFLLFTSKTLGL